jgi:hypothetical protein
MRKLLQCTARIKCAVTQSRTHVVFASALGGTDDGGHGVREKLRTECAQGGRLQVGNADKLTRLSLSASQYTSMLESRTNTYTSCWLTTCRRPSQDYQVLCAGMHVKKPPCKAPVVVQSHDSPQTLHANTPHAPRTAGPGSPAACLAGDSGSGAPANSTRVRRCELQGRPVPRK